MVLKRNYNKFSTVMLYIRLLKKWGKKEKKNFLFANFLLLLVAGSTAMYPLIIDFAFNSITEKNNKSFYYIPLFVVGITLLKSLSQFYQTIFVGKVANSIIKSIQIALYEKIINFDILLLNEYKSGSLQSRFINDLNILKEAIIRTINNLIRDFFTLIGLIISMFYLDWVLSLCVILIYPLCIRPIIAIGKSTRIISIKLQEKISGASAFLNESFSAIRVIKTFNLENLQKSRAEKKFNQIFNKNIEIVKTRAKIEPTLEVIGGIAISLVLLFAGIRISSGNADIGSFSGFISALLIAVQPARALGTLNTILQEGAASLLRLEDMLKKQNITFPIKKNNSINISKANILFKNVSFSYDKRKVVLKNINCLVREKEDIVIAGENGSGKSTFINMIPRLFDPSKGKILIDGKDTTRFNHKSLRDHIALVSQDVILFDTSIKNNIKIAKEGSTFEDIVNACKYADAHNFIIRLSKGYDTVVGERGLNLSGGQRQKIAIARAILKNPKILILDEAYSSLDKPSEKRINAAIEEIGKNITTFKIVHDIKTIKKAKRIFFFKEGQLTGDGNHETLVKTNGSYKNYFFKVSEM